MIGGYVIGIESDLSDDSIIVFVIREKGVFGHCRVKTTRGINSSKVKVGDTVWWQAGKILWTPKSPVIDIELPKVGNSY